MDAALLDLEQELEEESRMEEEVAPAQETRLGHIYLLFPSVFLGSVALLMLAPIMPLLKVEWFDHDFKRAQEVSGAASSAKYLLSCLASPLLGRLSDRFGRRPLIRITNVGSFLPVLALYLTGGNSPTAYFATFILCGVLTSGQLFLSVAYVADCTAQEDRARMFGYLGATSGVAFVLTPLLVRTLLSGWSNLALFKLSMLLLGINALWIELVLPESLSTVKPTTPTSKREGGARAVELNATQRNLLFWLSGYVIATHLPESGVGEIAMIYLNDVLHVDREEMRNFSSGYLFLTGIGLFASQTLYIYWFGPKASHTVDRLLVIACAANVVHMWIYVSLAWNHSLSVAYFNILVTSFMFVGATATNALISKHTNQQEQGYMLGKLDSVRSFVSAIGPVLFSMLYSYFGSEFAFPAAPFVFGAVFASIAMVIALGPLRKQPVEEEEEEAGVGLS